MSGTGAAPAFASGSEPFTRVTDSPIATDTGAFHACAWADGDNDGYIDLFTGRNSIYRNLGNGRFERIFLGGGTEETGGHWGDYDNDGFPDLLRTFFLGGIRLQFNGSTNFFYDILAGNPAAADVDNDGALDFTVWTLDDRLLLYRNTGSRSFESVELAHGPGGGLMSFSPVWGDYDNDGSLDLFVAGSAGSGNLLLRNDGSGALIPQSEWGIGRLTAYAAAWGDYDNDGWFDLVVVGITNALYRNNHNGRFSAISMPLLSNASGNSLNVAWGDYDNDGLLDLFVANQRADNALFRNLGDGSFAKVDSRELSDAQMNSTSCAWGDYDNDGFVDLFVTNGGSDTSNFLFRNNRNGNAWLKVRCRGTVSNSSAIGAKVRLKARIRGKVAWQLREVSGGNGRSQNDFTCSFGLGDADLAEVVRVEWLSGAVQEFKNVAVGQTITMHEPPLAIASPRFASGQFAMNILSLRGSPVQVQASDDLRRWATVQTLTNTTGREVFSTAGGREGQRFYRLISR